MARVTLDDVRKVYDEEVVAVHGASFEVADGEFLVLVGPSGCGKSTTLRVIAGLETITQGTVAIGDRIVNRVPPKDRDIAMVFQNYALYPHMSVYENLAFGLKLRKYSKKEIDRRVKEAAEILGITPELNRKPKALSGGQRQRVAVGRAIVRKPKVFLFDEPLSNLDAKLRVQMRAEIGKLHTQLQATMIYVTHDQVEAMTMGDRIVVMNEGHIQQIDTPLALYNNPANRFVAGFIGSPAMNFIEGRLVRDDGLLFQSDTDRVVLPLPDAIAGEVSGAAGKPVTLGIRPEDLYVGGTHHVEGPVEDAEFQLDVTEPMGNEIVTYISNADSSLVARLEPQSLPDPGESITIAFDLQKLKFFDAESGDALIFEDEPTHPETAPA